MLPTHPRHLGSSDLLVALLTAARAESIIKEKYGQVHVIAEKGIGDLVSEVDQAADEAIAKSLHAECPRRQYFVGRVGA